MEERILYKCQEERLYHLQVEGRDVVVMEPQADECQDGAISNSTIRSRTSTHCELNHVLITSDQLKDLMSKNERVEISRDTLIVSENLERNTIEIKRFQFIKSLVQVGKLVRLKFKIKRKSFMCLSIHKTTGEFSVYRKSGKPKNVNILTRKNMYCDSVANFFHHLLLSDICTPSQLEIGLRTFYTALGYPGDTAQSIFDLYHFKNDIPRLDFISKYGAEYTDDVNGSSGTKANSVNSDAKYKKYTAETLLTSLKYFTFLHYLTSIGLKIDSLSQFRFVAYNFRHNKKNYIGTSIEKYFCDQFRISNPEYVRTALEIVEERCYATKDDYNINVMTLRILDYYNVDPSFLYQLMSTVKGGLYFNDTLPNYYFDVLKLYDFTAPDVIRCIEDGYSWEQTMFVLDTFRSHGIKLKIKSLLDFQFYRDDILRIYDTIIYSNLKTGTFLLNKKFLQRVKRYYPKHQIKIHHIRHRLDPLRPFKGGMVETDAVERDRGVEYRPLFSHHYILPTISLMLDGEVQLTVEVSRAPQKNDNVSQRNDKELSRSLGRRNDTIGHIFMHDGMDNLERALKKNVNNITNTLEIEYLYSKLFFENTCKNVFGINTEKYIEYLK